MPNIQRNGIYMIAEDAKLIPGRNYRSGAHPWRLAAGPVVLGRSVACWAEAEAPQTKGHKGGEGGACGSTRRGGGSLEGRGSDNWCGGGELRHAQGASGVRGPAQGKSAPPYMLCIGMGYGISLW